MIRIVSLQIIFLALYAGFVGCSDTKSGHKPSVSELGAKHSEKSDSDSLQSLVDWVRENQIKIITSLRNEIRESDQMSPNHEYDKKTIVVTEFAPGILGEFARKTKLIDSTLNVHYTVTKAFAEKPVIRPKASEADGYENLKWKADKSIKFDSLVFEYKDTQRFEKKRRWN